MPLKNVPRQKLLHVAIGAVVAIVLVVPLCVLAYVESGIYNVAASRPHTRFTEWITHETMIHSVKRHSAGIEPPAGVTLRQLAAGLCAYEAHCVACHGAAGIARRHWAEGMEPAPPYLLDVQQRFAPTQLFWIVKNGIKMTGMPAWRAEMTDGEIWSVVAWLEASAKLPPRTFANWRKEGRCAGYPNGFLSGP